MVGGVNVYEIKYNGAPFYVDPLTAEGDFMTQEVLTVVAIYHGKTLTVVDPPCSNGSERMFYLGF